jgi:hypothetical protein
MLETWWSFSLNAIIHEWSRNDKDRWEKIEKTNKKLWPKKAELVEKKRRLEIETGHSFGIAFRKICREKRRRRSYWADDWILKVYETRERKIKSWKCNFTKNSWLDGKSEWNRAIVGENRKVKWNFMICKTLLSVFNSFKFTYVKTYFSLIIIGDSSLALNWQMTKEKNLETVLGQEKPLQT